MQISYQYGALHLRQYSLVHGTEMQPSYWIEQLLIIYIDMTSLHSPP